MLRFEFGKTLLVFGLFALHSDFRFLEAERIPSERFAVKSYVEILFNLFTLLFERFRALLYVFFAAAYAFLSVSLFEFFLLYAAVRIETTIDCVLDFDDLFLLDLVVVGTLEYLAHFKQVLIEFFRVGLEIHFFLVGFGRHFFETFHFNGTFHNHFRLDFLRLFDFFFYFFFRLLFRLFFFFGFRRSFGWNFLVRFFVFFGFDFLNIVLFFFVFFLFFEFLRVLVAVYLVFLEVHISDTQEIGKFLVFHVEIGLALIVQALKHHSVERHHTAQSLLAFGVDGIVFHFVRRGKTARLLISLDKLPKRECFLEVRLFQNDVRTHDRRTNGRGIAH